MSLRLIFLATFSLTCFGQATETGFVFLLELSSVWNVTYLFHQTGSKEHENLNSDTCLSLILMFISSRNDMEIFYFIEKLGDSFKKWETTLLIYKSGKIPRT